MNRRTCTRIMAALGAIFLMLPLTILSWAILSAISEGQWLIAWVFLMISPILVGTIVEALADLWSVFKRNGGTA